MSDPANPGPAATTMAAGLTRSTAYGPLIGYTGGRSFVPLSKCSGIILGLPYTGKSELVQSNPRAYIINTDLSGTSGLSTPAMIWPMVNQDNQPLDDSGRPFIMDWSHIETKLQILRDLSRNNQPRPATVVFDSMATTVKLLIDHYLKSKDATDWGAIDGRAGWNWVYSKAESLITDLKRHGYGVFFTVHMTNTKVRLNEDRFAIRPELTITDNFWSRIHPIVEVVMCVRTAIENQTITTPITTMVRGQPYVENRTSVVERTVHYVTFNEEDVRYICKVRTAQPLPNRIPLGRSNSWGSLEQVLLTAQSSPVPSP